MLPEDGHLSDLHTVQPIESQGEGTSNDTADEYYSSSFIPTAATPDTEIETIEHAVQYL